MTSAIVMERSGMGMPGMGTAAAGPMGATGGMPTAPQWMMVPTMHDHDGEVYRWDEDDLQV